MTTRWILHADMDAFYASVEQRERPELRGKPVIVGAHSARGVVTAASYEARKYGVRSAMPGFRARQLCPDAVFLPGRMELYAEVSQQVHEVFVEFTPQVEPLALDEAFLDVTGSMHFYPGPRELGLELKRRVRERTQLVVSVGLAPNKLVAKVACTSSKPDGLAVIRQEEVRGLLDPLPIARLWGIGPTTAQKLRGLGVETIGQLAAVPDAVLRPVLGRRLPEFLARARGEDDSPVISDRIPKSCGEENTFETDVHGLQRVSAALTAHAETVARRLRHAGLVGRTVTLKIKLGRANGTRVTRFADAEPRYPLLTRSRSFAVPTADAAQIRQTALELWEEAGIAVGVRLLGVSVSNLQSASAARQLDLFGQAQRADRLGPTLDAIVERFGKSAIHRAVDDLAKLSPTTRRK